MDDVVDIFITENVNIPLMDDVVCVCIMQNMNMLLKNGIARYVYYVEHEHAIDG